MKIEKIADGRKRRMNIRGAPLRKPRKKVKRPGRGKGEGGCAVKNLPPKDGGQIF